MSKFRIGDVVVVKSGDPNRIFEVVDIVYYPKDPATGNSPILYNISEPKPNRMGGLISYTEVSGDHLEYATSNNPNAAYDRAMKGI